MGEAFDYHNASLAGDPRWASASRWTRRAPLLVVIILALSIIETILGAVWISMLKANMTVPKIIQTLIVPGLAFFNALPSLHLHCMARRNSPGLALSFSILYALLFLASWMTFLVSCNLPASATSVGLRQVECSVASAGVHSGPSLAMWWIVVLLQIVMMGLYAAHAAMAWYVRGVEKVREIEAKEHGVSLARLTDSDQAKARERWREITEMGVGNF